MLDMTKVKNLAFELECPVGPCEDRGRKRELKGTVKKRDLLVDER